LALSTTALASLDRHQLAVIEESAKPVALDIPTIEKSGWIRPLHPSGHPSGKALLKILHSTDTVAAA
jgi:hypothetical protein